jgi:hypothetical protein
MKEEGALVCRMCMVVQRLERDLHEDLIRGEIFTDHTTWCTPYTRAMDIESGAQA